MTWVQIKKMDEEVVQEEVIEETVEETVEEEVVEDSAQNDDGSIFDYVYFLNYRN